VEEAVGKKVLGLGLDYGGQEQSRELLKLNNRPEKK
jgi:hypothetical protein